MSDTRLLPVVLCGLSFSIAELLLLQSWAEAHALQMTVRLDHGVDQEEYEEVLAFSKVGSTVCQWMIWRNDQAVVIQPLIGRPQRYDTVAAVLEALTPPQAETLTDIQAPHWPRQDRRKVSLPTPTADGVAVSFQTGTGQCDGVQVCRADLSALQPCDPRMPNDLPPGSDGSGDPARRGGSTAG